jgi:hypothetical protein
MHATQINMQLPSQTEAKLAASKRKRGENSNKPTHTLQSNFALRGKQQHQGARMGAARAQMRKHWRQLSGKPNSRAQLTAGRREHQADGL